MTVAEAHRQPKLISSAAQQRCLQARGTQSGFPGLREHMPQPAGPTVQQSNRDRSVVRAKMPTLAQPIAHTAAVGGRVEWDG